MNLQQLRFVQEAVRRGLNLSEVAKALHTSQPGVSKAILELEHELGVDIFFRVLYDETSVDAQEQILREALEKQCISVVLAPNSTAHRKTLDLFRQKNLPIV